MWRCVAALYSVFLLFFGELQAAARCTRVRFLDVSSVGLRYHARRAHSGEGKEDTRQIVTALHPWVAPDSSRWMSRPRRLTGSSGTMLARGDDRGVKSPALERTWVQLAVTISARQPPTISGGSIARGDLVPLKAWPSARSSKTS